VTIEGKSMGHRLLRYLIIPIIVYPVFLFALLILTFFANLIKAPTGLINVLNGFLSFYAIGFLVLIFVWWGISFSRWLHEKFKWETLPYAIINLFLGFGIIGVSLAIAVGINYFIGNLSSLIFFVGLLGGGFWYVRSAYEIVSNREQGYNSIHWLPLKEGMILLNLRDYFFSKKRAETSPGLFSSGGHRHNRALYQGSYSFKKVQG
jgi:hypothetical protein